MTTIPFVRAPWRAVCFVVLAIGGLAGNAVGGPVPIVDQSYETPGVTGNTIVAARFEGAQTFTVGVDGRLTSVDVNLGRQSETVAPITLDIRRTHNGIPAEPNQGANILTSLTLPASAVPVSNGIDTQFVSFDVPDVAIHRGELLAIVLRTDAGPVFNEPNDIPFFWAADNDGHYAGGRAFARGSDAAGPTWGDGDTFSLADTDHEFRTHAVPLPPAVWSGLIVMAGGAAVRLRHRRRRIA